MSSEPQPRGDDGLGRPRRPTGNFVDGLRSMAGLPRVIWVLGVASLLNDVSSEAIFPLLPVFLTSLGAPMRYIGLIEGLGLTDVFCPGWTRSGHARRNGVRVR